eukprot:832319-Rhodomonas_salina.2
MAQRVRSTIAVEPVSVRRRVHSECWTLTAHTPKSDTRSHNFSTVCSRKNVPSFAPGSSIAYVSTGHRIAGSRKTSAQAMPVAYCGA